MVKVFPRGAAAGPTALRPQHLKDAISGAHVDEALEQLTALVNLLARGETPAELAPFLWP
eukprot:4367911-Karenia_brevis.AAC.1